LGVGRVGGMRLREIEEIGNVREWFGEGWGLEGLGVGSRGVGGSETEGNRRRFFESWPVGRGAGTFHWLAVRHSTRKTNEERMTRRM